MKKLNALTKEMALTLIANGYRAEDIAPLFDVHPCTIWRLKQDALSTARTIKAQTATLNRLLEER